MEKVLLKWGLIDNLKTELKIPKQEFVSKLRSQVDISTIDIFGDMFDVFSSSKNVYKGTVSHNGFEIKKRRRFFDKQFSFATAKGDFQENEDILIINTVINGWNDLMFLFYGFALLFYIMFLFMIGSKDLSAFPIVFILFHAFLMFYVPFRMMKSSVKKIKYDLEREFHFIATK